MVKDGRSKIKYLHRPESVGFELIFLNIRKPGEGTELTFCQELDIIIIVCAISSEGGAKSIGILNVTLYYVLCVRGVCVCVSVWCVCVRACVCVRDRGSCCVSW